MRSTIHLSDLEKEDFRKRFIISQMRSFARSAISYLEPADSLTESKHNLAVACLKMISEEAELAEDASDAIESLETGFHCGDCTYMPASCTRCHAESVLGLTTCHDLDPVLAEHIGCAFGWGDDQRTAREALEILASGICERINGWEKRPQEEFDALVPKWREEMRDAHAWLSAYLDSHASELASE